MSNRNISILAVTALVTGMLLGAFLIPQVNGFRWQLEFARLQADFDQYRRQVAPAIQAYNQAIERQQAAAQEADNTDDQK